MHAELFKFIFSLILRIRSKDDTDPVFPSVSGKEVISWSLLALCYTINNQLSFWLLIYMGPGQLSLGKSFSPMLTAVLLWQLYADYINSVQWGCLILTVAGLINVLYTEPEKDSNPAAVGQDVEYAKGDLLLSISLLFISCMITALSSVFNARLLQKGKYPLHVQNMLLYSQGFLLSFCAYWIGFTPSKIDGFFTGYGNINVICVLVSQSLMGIAISFAYKYGGAIVKTLATGSQAAILTVTKNDHDHYNKMDGRVIRITCTSYDDKNTILNKTRSLTDCFLG